MTALANVVGAAAGIPVVWDDQQHARPNYPYALLNVFGWTQVGFGEERTVQNDSGGLDVTVRQDEQLTLSINTFAKPANSLDATAVTYMNAIRRSLGLSSVQQTLRDAGIAVLDIASMQNLSGPGDGGMIQRYQMDVRLNAASITTDTAKGRITSVQADVKLTQPGKPDRDVIVTTTGA